MRAPGRQSRRCRYVAWSHFEQRAGVLAVIAHRAFESLRDTPEAFLLHFSLSEAFEMDHWISVHIEQRREELHAEAARARIIRMLENGRSRDIRGRILHLLALFVA